MLPRLMTQVQSLEKKEPVITGSLMSLCAHYQRDFGCRANVLLQHSCLLNMWGSLCAKWRLIKTADRKTLWDTQPPHLHNLLLLAGSAEKSEQGLYTLGQLSRELESMA